MLLLGSASGRKRDLVNCAQCCDTALGDAVPCNARLCNLSKYSYYIKQIFIKTNNDIDIYMFSYIKCMHINLNRNAKNHK